MILRYRVSLPGIKGFARVYEVKDTAIYANVNASKVVDMMKRFIEMHDEPMFFILELPCKNEDGITSEKTSNDSG